jgi:RNA polymerase sigma factor (sigma-70 family)
MINSSLVKSTGYNNVTHIHSMRAEVDEWIECLQQVAQQNRQAFHRLFKHFAPQIKGFGLTTVIADRSGQFADELVQEVMLTVWNKAASYDPEKAGVSTWIFTIARNKRIDLLRRLNRQETPIDIDEIWPIEDENISSKPSSLLQQETTTDRVKEQIALLPENQREALIMSYLQGKSHSEIADELELPLGTVKSRIRLAMQRLEAVFDRQDY